MVVLAKGFDKERNIKKKKFRIIDISKYKPDSHLSIRTLITPFFANEDEIIFNNKKLNCVTKLKPNKKELIKQNLHLMLVTWNRMPLF